MSAPDPAAPDPAAPRPRAAHGDDGRILLLTLGLVVLGLMLVGMVVSATAVHLDHKRLYNLADLLAVSAADAARPGQRLLTADSAGLTLTSADVARQVAEDLAAHPFPEQLPDDLAVLRADSPDGRTARVTLTTTSHPPLLAWFTRTLGHGFDLTATSTARAETGSAIGGVSLPGG
ncbi:pilus assembly protein TadG-related protein [Xylanimonas ulmi]|uniref:Putative Flp pilus-assembly TadE/G-like protein n=1 Tax=Xylanimonas ulmi TaxID=228973 RepID=A0A4Q7M3T3_9MICO|nr:hypothetical protein [Xylanibacterium ulmi]RZS61643.1 putative Flp pilus-assembly TadE/G-like protein [Xylanibacterium ulmi]